MRETKVKINYVAVDGTKKSVEVTCTSISCGGVQVGYFHPYDCNAVVYVDDGNGIIVVRDAKCCTQCFNGGRFDITKGINVEVGNFNDIEIDLDTKKVIALEIKNINREKCN